MTLLIGTAAECNSAKQQIANLRYDFALDKMQMKASMERNSVLPGGLMKPCRPERFERVVPAGKTARAFTLVELLVVIAVIAVLAGILLPVLSSGKKKAGTAQCANNLKQVGAGLLMYLDDHGGIFPGIASKMLGFHPEDWIYWRTNAAYPQFDKSPILRTVGTVTRDLLRCPLDRTDDARWAMFGGGDGPYLFSYSLNGYGTFNGVSIGMSSVFEGPVGSETAYLFKQSQVRNPSGKLMLAEEPGTLHSDDNPAGLTPIQDGRWMLMGDPLTKRHSGGKAVLTFADGHVEAVKASFGDEEVNSRPDL